MSELDPQLLAERAMAVERGVVSISDGSARTIRTEVPRRRLNGGCGSSGPTSGPIPVAGGAAIEVGGQGALSDESAGIAPPLAHRDLGRVFRVVIQSIGRGLQCALHDRPNLR